jgi:hypothetical protein
VTDVVYTDPPDDPSQPLVLGALEPIGFTCVRALDWLMVDMGAGYEECAFREGAFRGPYAAHSSISGDLLTGTVLREGGWLAPPKLIPQVVPAPVIIPPTGRPLDLIYQVDLTALASQSTPAVGSYTVDGLTWWLKGQFTGLPFGTVNNAALISGNGLRLSGDYGTLAPGAVDDPFLRWWLPLANIPNCNPAAPIIVRARMVCSNPSDSGGFIGLISTTSDGVKVLAAQRATEIYCGPPFSSGPGQMRVKGGTATEATVSSRGVVLANQGVSFMGVSQMQPGFADVGSQVWGGTFPAITGFVPQSTSPQFASGARSNPGIIFAMTCNGGSTKTTDLTHLSIYQPKGIAA